MFHWLLDADKLCSGLNFKKDKKEIEMDIWLRTARIIAVLYARLYLHKKKADNTKLNWEVTKRNLDLIPFYWLLQNYNSRTELTDKYTYCLEKILLSFVRCLSVVLSLTCLMFIVCWVLKQNFCNSLRFGNFIPKTLSTFLSVLLKLSLENIFLLIRYDENITKTFPIGSEPELFMLVLSILLSIAIDLFRLVLPFRNSVN